jgi:DNA-binding FadR family transcriptional regulator
MLRCASDEDAVEADIQFHRAVAQIAGNEILALMLESLADLGRESRRMTIGNVGRHRAIAHHSAIIAAIAAHDPAAAARAMKHHMDEAARDLAAKTRVRK